MASGVNYVSLRLHTTYAAISRSWIAFVALTGANTPIRLTSEERGDDRIWGYHSPRPRHHRPVEPQSSIPLSQEGRETEQSPGAIHWIHTGYRTFTRAEINRLPRTLRLRSIPMSE